ncbi:MAG: RNA-binding cell elongation regulator Jag/EloR [Thermacetogeniaceae bacterium]
MSWVEASGTTIEEARQEALELLGATSEEVELEVLDSGSKGFLGIIGNKMARVRARLKPAPGQVINEFLAQVVQAIGLEVTFQVKSEEERWRVEFSGRDVRILIGRRGETLNSLQLITSLVVNRRLEDKVRLIMDAEGYRDRREETLQRLAKRLTEQVRRTRQEVVLEPMTPNERRVIHVALQDDPWVETSSTGDEPYRKVIISLRRKG